MRKRILNYRKHIDDLLMRSPENTDWNCIRQEHLIQISFFQHERFIHLIVTVLFALLMFISFGILLITENIALFTVSGLFLVLLIPYIFHYFLLENEVQKMYAQYDSIVEKLKQ